MLIYFSFLLEEAIHTIWLLTSKGDEKNSETTAPQSVQSQPTEQQSTNTSPSEIFVMMTMQVLNCFHQYYSWDFFPMLDHFLMNTSRLLLNQQFSALASSHPMISCEFLTEF